jgi:hypothetical protein
MWILLPEKHIIDAYLNCHDRPDRDFNKLVMLVCLSLLFFHRRLTSSTKERAYDYAFIPARNLHAFEIRRYNEVMECTQIAGPDKLLSYYYPFNDFPTITSHIHPTLSSATSVSNYRMLTTFSNISELTRWY